VSKGIVPIGKKNPNLPFHPGVRAGDFIFVSGQVAKDENGNMCVGNIEEETRWTIESIRRILALDGADLSDGEGDGILEDADFGRYVGVRGVFSRGQCPAWSGAR
jgi:enamine deaminase RidA (YjgF/YER057c/UK114 family)